MLKFLHLSDMHIHTKPSKNTDVLTRLKYCRENYSTHARIITGDITDDGDERQYENAMYAILGAEIYVCPGNHDFGLMGNLYDKKRAARFDVYLPADRHKYHRRLKSPGIDYVTDNDCMAVLIGLNTCIRSRHPFDFARGKVGLWQRFTLKRALLWANRLHPEATRIVYFHHHPFDRGPFTAMSDGKKLMKTLQNNCELVLFGHKHKHETWDIKFELPVLVSAGKMGDEATATEITINPGPRDFSIKEVPIL